MNGLPSLYPRFVRIFYGFCKGDVLLPPDYYSVGERVRRSMENIDRFLLIPAGLTKAFCCDHFGSDMAGLDRNSLANYRNGKKPFKNYIITAYSDINAVERTSNYFSIFLPLNIRKEDREQLLDCLFKGLNLSMRIISVTDFYDDYLFYSILSKIFVYCITEDPVILTIDKDDVEPSKIMEERIKSIRLNGIDAITLGFIDEIYKEWQSENTVFLCGIRSDESRSVKRKICGCFSEDDVYLFLKELYSADYSLDEKYSFEVKKLEKSCFKRRFISLYKNNGFTCAFRFYLDLYRSKYYRFNLTKNIALPPLDGFRIDMDDFGDFNNSELIAQLGAIDFEVFIIDNEYIGFIDDIDVNDMFLKNFNSLYADCSVGLRLIDELFK